MEALDAAYRVLKAANEPLHFKELYKRACALGWEPKGAKPERALYRAVRMDIRNEGEHSVFRQPQDATLCLADLHPEYTPLSEIKGRDPEERRIRYHQRRYDRALCPKQCGYCKFVEFDGVMEVTREYGVCSRFKESERLSVKFDAKPCSLWEERSADQRRHDEAISSKLHKMLVELAPKLKARRQARDPFIAPESRQIKGYVGTVVAPGAKP